MRCLCGAALLCALAVCVARAQASGASTAAVAAGAKLAYVTETSSSASTVWVANADGTGAQSLGLGDDPLISPNGQMVAASLFGTGSGTETGPALGLYSTVGAAGASYLRLSTANVVPLAWSPDSRYLAAFLMSTSLRDIAQRSGLIVLDTSTGAVKTIAHGQIYGASFAPDGSDRIAYASARTLSGTAPTNIYISNPDGSGLHAFTHDGHSLNPVWGERYLAFDRERFRRDAYPAFQIWLAVTRPGAVVPRRLTNVKDALLVSGLVPLAFSADGTRLVSELEGEDTSEAWAVTVSSGHVQRLTSHGRGVVASGISRDGSEVLIDEGAFEQPQSSGRVASIPFTGGRASVIVAQGTQGSWNG